MDPTLEALLRSWPFDPWVVVPLLLTAGLYLRGWQALQRRGSAHVQGFELAAFLAGLGALGLALASPIEPFSSLLLSVHMVQHLLLMMVAPPLLWLGAPALPLLRGLPIEVRRYWVGPFLRSPLLWGVFQRLTHPVVAWLLYVGCTYLWHVPALFDWALGDERWHYLEHLCFLGTALLFWWPVIQPYPSRPQCAPWVLIPYLLLADVANTVLSAILCFAEQPLYPHYQAVPRLWGLSALEDQATAGVLMWVPGSLAFLLPLVWIGSWLLASGKEEGTKGTKGTAETAERIALPLVPAHPVIPSSRHPVIPSSSFDLLRLPLVGRFLAWRHARLAVQLLLFGGAVAILLDGLFGPPAAAMNLAGVLPWIHWRGLVVLGLLVAGNVFCLGCPFLLPRTVARRWRSPPWRWPRALRSKWLAVGLLVLFLVAYEVFALWDSPWWTAWIAVGYFAAALVIDSCFRGAAFCKYVCPIGQFNFVQSLVSPLEVRVREPETCRQCATKDCIRGNATARGCELDLFAPRKAGNLDCTFCLDCIHACPHDNIGILPTAPGAELWHDRQRSGVGRFGRRPDLAALVLVLVFGAFANAAGMVAPVVEWQDRAAVALGLASPALVAAGGLLAAMIGLPILLVGGAAGLSRWWGRRGDGWLATAVRFAPALLPLGAGMWLAHYTFHFLSSPEAIVPVLQRAAGDLGIGLGTPTWGCDCCAPVAGWLLRLEIVFLDLGLLLSLYAAYRLALDGADGMARGLGAFAPWAVLMLLLFAVGVWLLFQPMEMRGTMMALR